MEKVKYCYPAVFGYDPKETEISVVFPDLDCATSGVGDEDALNSARELLESIISGMKQDKEKFPASTNLIGIKTEENEKAVLVCIEL